MLIQRICVGSAGRVDLLDPTLAARDMLRHLFPEDEVHAYQPVKVEARCRAELPEFREVEAGRWVRCHFPG